MRRTRQNLFFGIVLLTLLTTLPALAEPRFPTRVFFTFWDSFSKNFVSGDFDGDGDKDLAGVIGGSFDTVTVLLGNGDGTFSSRVEFPTGDEPEAIDRGDFNGDGVIDLVTANGSELSEGDAALRLNEIWRDAFTGELHHHFERFQDTQEAKLGLTDEHIDSLRFTTEPKGLAAGAMNDTQHEILRALTETYVYRLPDRLAEIEMQKITGESFSSLHLAWAGGDDPSRPHYYRIQGHRLLMEYDNTARDANHIHTVWRDPVNDFGMDALSAHRHHEH